MIELITGQPGGGKTLFSVHRIVDDLVNDPRPVVTNVALDVGALAEYFNRHKIDVDLSKKLWIITDFAEVKSFFRYRGGLEGVYQMPPDPALYDGARKLPNEEYLPKVKSWFSDNVRDNGVIYYIDEAHDYYSAREWASNSVLALYYFSKHRHLGDHVVLITQHIPQLDKQLRNLISEYHYMRNDYAKKFANLFRVPGGMVRKSYYDPPSPNVKPFEQSKRKIDVQIASCYRSLGAVKETGSGVVEIKKRVKGLPMWSIGVVTALGALVLVAGLRYLPGFVLGAIKPDLVANAQRVTGQRPSASSEKKDESAKKSVDTGANYYESASVFNDRAVVTVAGKRFFSDMYAIDSTGLYVAVGDKIFGPRPRLGVAMKQPNNQNHE